MKRFNAETLRVEEKKKAKEALAKLAESKGELKKLAAEAKERRVERKKLLERRKERSKIVAAAAHSHNLKIKKRNAQSMKKVQKLRHLSMRIPHAFKLREERMVQSKKHKAILNELVFPHVQELHKFNNDFDNAISDAKIIEDFINTERTIIISFPKQLYLVQILDLQSCQILQTFPNLHNWT